MNPQILQTIAGKRLRHRLFMEGGVLTYLLKGDQEAVRLDDRAWRRLSQEFESDVAAATTRLKWSFNLAIPALILSLVIMANVPIVTAAADWIDRFPPWNVVLGILVIGWLPLLGLAQHWVAVSQANERFEMKARTFPRAAVPGKPRPVFHQNLGILVFLLVGPAILTRAIGSLFPDLYRNTPLSGAQLGWIDLAAITAVGLWLLTRPKAVFDV